MWWLFVGIGVGVLLDRAVTKWSQAGETFEAIVTDLDEYRARKALARQPQAY